MAKLTEIEATYRVVTPLFCAGADQRRAEIRLPSFKGVLRFWWRALAWSRLHGDLKKIQHEEDKLFGSAGPKGGQSRLIILPFQGNARNSGIGHNLSLDQGARYLAYGLLETQMDKRRAYLDGGFNFTAQMRVRDCDAQTMDLQDALIALGLFGGMGARSRRGFGSLSLKSIHVRNELQRQEPQSMDDLARQVENLCSRYSRTGVPLYTALSGDARYLLLSSNDRGPLKLLDRIGQELKDAVRIVPRAKRIAFGLPRRPLNDRRASPLFIHIHECGGKPVAVLSFLPARFLPQGKSGISVRGNRVSQLPEEQLYKPIGEFLDRLGSHGGQLSVSEVRP